MPNKSVIFSTPTATEVDTITVRCSGGVVTGIDINGRVLTTDPETNHNGYANVELGDLTAGEQSALSTFLAGCVTQYISKLGF